MGNLTQEQWRTPLLSIKPARDDKKCQLMQGQQETLVRPDPPLGGCHHRRLRPLQLSRATLGAGDTPLVARPRRPRAAGARRERPQHETQVEWTRWRKAS